MSAIPSIDLHPEKVGGAGPEAALQACRAFLERSLKAGHRQVRIITGVGLRGDGTPRLRSRVENEVLGAYFSAIEQQAYEQGGAVIKLWLRAQSKPPSGSWQRQQRRQAERQALAGRAERLMVAQDRLELAEDALDEGDLRRCRLKLNQVAKEFGWPLGEAGLNAETAEKLLQNHWAKLKELDA
jgi:DNA-nicking Smr family endonuclease